LPTAALALLGLASLAVVNDEKTIARRRLIGGACLLAGTLSRYEVWPLAMGFTALSLLDLKHFCRARSSLLGGVFLALLGPLSWIAWNAHAHGDAFHFVARVTAYRRALGGDEASAPARLVAYPLSLLREEPELLALLGVALLAVMLSDRAALRASIARFARPIGLVLFQIAALSWALVKDGAPTHHPERALLTALLLTALIAGDLGRIVAASPRLRLAVGAGAIVAIAGGAAIVRSRVASEGFGARAEEVAAGRLAQVTVPAGERVLLEVVDYGHLAVLAALGAPERAELDRSIDPREPRVASSFVEASALRARVVASGVTFVLGHASEVTREVLGTPVSSAGSWAIWRVSASPERPR
ncbi:MAG: hypothetical protein ABI193_14385, partial [Minicystis sp.]